MSEAMIIVDHLDRDGENVVDKSPSHSVFCSSVCVQYNAQKWKSGKKGHSGSTLNGGTAHYEFCACFSPQPSTAVHAYVLH